MPFAIAKRIEAFRQGLRELGYTEGKNIVIEWRFAEEKRDRLPALATELVHLKVDVIVTAGPLVTRAGKEATSTIPIVMGFGKDPVRDGIIASLARPGGNITGVVVAPEDVLAGKRLELIKEAVPRSERVAVLASREESFKLQVQEARKVAGALGVKLIVVELQNGECERAFAAMTTDKAIEFFNSPPNIACPPFTSGRSTRTRAA